MDLSYHWILIGALLLLISILATSFSSRIGMPILLVFLVIGMIAGEQGLGKIDFQDLQIAHFIGVLALAIILLDAGLHTKTASFRLGLLPALSLASCGILITSGLMGLLASAILQLPLREGLLLGAILGPTDAAAVFALLYAMHTQLKPRVMATLEIESGSNDAMAVLLTNTMMTLFTASVSTKSALAIFTLLLREIGLGFLIGMVAGYLIIRFSNRIQIAVSLYPLLTLASGLLVFAATHLMGGSSYLAIYVTGILIGNSRIHQHDNSLRLHDSLAWLSQISMFIMLGLLVTPSALLPNLWPALWIAVGLIVVARPLAVWLSLLPFHFAWREKAFIAWTGLRGAVPIILALNPLLAGFEHAPLYFNITFFVVIISTALQGWPLPILARWLKIKAN